MDLFINNFGFKVVQMQCEHNHRTHLIYVKYYSQNAFIEMNDLDWICKECCEYCIEYEKEISNFRYFEIIKIQ